MSLISKLFASEVSQPVEAVGKVLDNLFTSDGERLDKQAVLERLRQQPLLAQVELNKVEAQSRFWFNSGWRPAIGWTCAAGLAFSFMVNPILQWATGDQGPDIPIEGLYNLVIAMLGLGGLRSFEKLKGLTK